MCKLLPLKLAGSQQECFAQEEDMIHPRGIQLASLGVQNQSSSGKKALNRSGRCWGSQVPEHRVSMQLKGQFFVETRTRQNFTSLPMPPGQHQQSLTQPKKPPSFPTMRGIPHLVAPKTGHCPPNLPQIWYSSYQLQLSTREHFRFCCSLMIFYIQKNLPPLVSPTSAV